MFHDTCPIHTEHVNDRIVRFSSTNLLLQKCPAHVLTQTSFHNCDVDRWNVLAKSFHSSLSPTDKVRVVLNVVHGDMVREGFDNVFLAVECVNEFLENGSLGQLSRSFGGRAVRYTAL